MPLAGCHTSASKRRVDSPNAAELAPFVFLRHPGNIRGDICGALFDFRARVQYHCNYNDLML